ncbi:carboxypeptidase-like regulatory domain-containing protein [Hymenobacter edaphi]|uniref:Carboxypeptidase regulatory-like domain-containing protein n=1 Tax=Hymenobacter edaphi TaxID=2211146 RepID=A0A328BFQ3_9BACT|nr:carboxypeptidase-like regulatory domain-containing protein [Hymenobacter edaphi]RAK63918.1 hypothetical protein DLM85_20445 [Hymenobacter edaphi]
MKPEQARILSAAIIGLLAPVPALAQYNVHVLDAAERKPLPGATIVSEEPAKQIVTDQQGQATLGRPRVLRVSHIGYKTSPPLQVAGNAVVDTVLLEPETFTLPEVAVVANSAPAKLRVITSGKPDRNSSMVASDQADAVAFTEAVIPAGTSLRRIGLQLGNKRAIAEGNLFIRLAPLNNNLAPIEGNLLTKVIEVPARQMHPDKNGQLVFDLSSENIVAPQHGFAVVLGFTPTNPDELGINNSGPDEGEMLAFISTKTGLKRKVAASAFPMLLSGRSNIAGCRFWRYSPRTHAWLESRAGSLVPVVTVSVE